MENFTRWRDGYSCMEPTLNRPVGRSGVRDLHLVSVGRQAEPSDTFPNFIHF
jgi:hypothetical protein